MQQNTSTYSPTRSYLTSPVLLFFAVIVLPVLLMASAHMLFLMQTIESNVNHIQYNEVVSIESQQAPSENSELLQASIDAAAAAHTSELIQQSYVGFVLLGITIIMLVALYMYLLQRFYISRKTADIDALQDRFLHIVAHEFHTPIRLIGSHLYSVQENTRNAPSHIQDQMSRVITSSQRLSTLIEDMTHVSRIQRKELDLTPQVFSPAHVARQVMEELRHEADRKGLSFVLEDTNHAADLNIYVNPHRFKEILQQIISNAIKYTQSGAVTASIAQDPTKKGFLRVDIVDTGVGIAGHEQGKIFSKFYRIRSRDTSSTQGTGLGLWIAKQLTSQLGGSIYIESVQGVGSRFTVIFPLRRTQ